MPNHVTNILKFNGNAERFQEMLGRIQNEEYGRGSIDFNKIIPMPESLNIQSGSMTRRGLEAYQGFLKVRTDIKPEDWAEQHGSKPTARAG